VVAAEEYLSTTYEPEREYVRGVLVERASATPAHDLVKNAAAEHLRHHAGTGGFVIAEDCRVELVPGAVYRVPDIVVAEVEAVVGSVLRSVPMAVIEVLSASDRLTDIVLRCREFWKRGVPEILILDPENSTSFCLLNGRMVECALDYLTLPDGSHVPFSPAAFFRELRDKLSRA
jgi:Uma2 family endonuclease